MKIIFSKICFISIVFLTIISNVKAISQENPNITSLSNNEIDALALELPTPIFGHKLVGGIGNVTIYIDSARTPRATYWQRLIKDAVNNWMYTGFGANPLYASYVTSSTNAKINIYANKEAYFGEEGWKTAAATYFFSTTSFVNPQKNDWNSSDIHLNDKLLRKDSISDEKATGTIAHEFGHAFGLDHNNINEYSIMCQSNAEDTGLARKVEKVQKVDNDALNRIYK